MAGDSVEYLQLERERAMVCACAFVRMCCSCADGRAGWRWLRLYDCVYSVRSVCAERGTCARHTRDALPRLLVRIVPPLSLIHI